MRFAPANLTSRWKLVLLALAVLIVKAVFLLLDHEPAYFYGDSGSYLFTATTKWIPHDRSFVYGLFLRRFGFKTHSLETAIVIQVCVSAIAAWLLGVALYKIFEVRFSIAAVFTVLCAIEPIQLIMERYVMTEAAANFLFALQFVLALWYLKRGRWWLLAASAAVGVLLITIRLSYLMYVLLLFGLPLVSPQARQHRWRSAALHLGIVALVFGFLVFRYEHWYGRLVHREPALIYQSGSFLLADFAPIVEPSDFPDAARRDELFRKLTFDRRQLWLRMAEHFGEGGLVRTIAEMYPDMKQADDLERATAEHAVLHHPWAAVKLALETYREYFKPAEFRDLVRVEQGYRRHMDAQTRQDLIRYYGVPNPVDVRPSITKTWEITALPWCWFMLCALPLSPLILLLPERSDWPLKLFCAIAALLFLEGAIVPVEAPTMRYLISAGWLLLLMLGLTADRLLFRRASIYART